jgi:hypothetical protein
MDNYRIETVSPAGATVRTETGLQTVRWADLRDAASERNAADLRSVYAPLLTQARTMADERGMLARRLSVPGALTGRIGHLDDAEAARLLAVAGEEDWPYTRADFVTETLDPDEAEAGRVEAEQRAATAREIESLARR